MKIKYKNTVDDLIELNFFLNTKLKDRKLKNYFLKYGYILIIIFVSIWYFNYNYEDKYLFLIIAIILSLIWLILQPIIVKIELRNRFKNKYISNEYLYNERILKLKTDKVILLKNENKTELSFKDISNITIYKNRIFIFKENFNIFAIIPIKSFSNDNEKDIFINTIKKNLY